jgi:L(+)-tartrate dehydratase alpha subunit
VSGDGHAEFRSDPQWFTDYMRRATVEWQPAEAVAAE